MRGMASRSLVLLFGLTFPFAAVHADPPVIAPAENLVLDGIPPVPAAIAESAFRYTEGRSASFASWHPKERRMLIATRFANTTQVHMITHPGGDRRQLTFFPEPAIGASFDPKEGNFFCFSKDTGGDEFYQNYRYDLATGETTLLTDGKKRNGTGVWSVDGNRMVYERVDSGEKGAFTEFRIVDPRDPKSDHLLVRLDGGGWSAVDWSPDDKTIAAIEYVSINESYIWLVDAETGAKTALTPRDAKTKSAYADPTFSKDGQGLYVATDAASEFLQLTYIDLKSRENAYLSSHIFWDVDSFDLSRDGKTIAFVTNEDGVSVLHLLDTTTKKEKPAPKLPVGVIAGLRWHSNSIDLALTITSSRAPGDIYTVNVQSGVVERWTESETGGINTASFPEPELLRWKSFDGKQISGFLYKPPARFTGKRPVIINIHGGPEGQARPFFLGRTNYFLNELGVAILYPNVRGSSGYGKTFLTLDNGMKREDSYKDIETLLETIGTREDLDAKRVMVTGGSYGGHMTLAIATRYNDRIACSVDIVGISNLRTFLENTQGYRQDLRRAEYGDEREPAMREFLERIAPLNHADRIRKPLFVVQGKNDPRVPKSEADQMVATLKKSGTPVWYLVANDEGHGFAKKANADFQFYATVAFVRQYLLAP